LVFKNLFKLDLIIGINTSAKKWSKALLYKEKLIISGKFLEHFQYEKWVEKGYKLNEGKSPILNHRGRAVAADEDKKLINRMKVMQKARSTIKRLINANVNCWKDYKDRVIPAKFFTITHAENITEYAGTDWTV
jgi:hypothetical protein